MRDETRTDDDRLEDARAALDDLVASPGTAPDVRAAAGDALARLREVLDR